MKRLIAALALLASALAAAAPPQEAAPVEPDREAFSRPLPALDETQREPFFRGRSLFRQSWVIAPAQDKAVSGLGPLYNRLACISCHGKNGRGRAPDGPDERMLSMLVRLSVPGRNPHGGPRPHPAYGDQLNEEGIPGVPGEGRASLHWVEHTERLADGEIVRLRAPRLSFHQLGYGPLASVLTSPRVGQQVIGLGLLGAVPAADLERFARETKPDGVRGKVNRVWNPETRQLEAGRFGHKANMPSLRAQIAGAFLGDIGITSALFPQENCTAAQHACQQAPSADAPELSPRQLDDVAFYLAHLAVPPQRNAEEPQVMRGEQQFARIGCAVCHRPELKTATDAKFPLLAGRTFQPHTDLLLHDMGKGLEDGRPDYLASGRQWRTAPLWGIGLTETISEHTQFLHDGRARNLLEAVMWHDGEAAAARRRFARLPLQEREDLQAFLRSL
jgi:CxxC motif-containing protein (DUF1111 family)